MIGKIARSLHPANSFDTVDVLLWMYFNRCAIVDAVKPKGGVLNLNFSQKERKGILQQ